VNKRRIEMKKTMFWILALVFMAACSTQKAVVKVVKHEENKVAQDTAAQDSVEYELETFDPKFETWYALHNNPSMYHSLSYYENWNRQYVTAWDANAMDPRKSWFFETIIGYDPTVEYGFELNHKLFYYFQYVEHVLKIQIIPGGGPKAPL